MHQTNQPPGSKNQDNPLWGGEDPIKSRNSSIWTARGLRNTIWSIASLGSWFKLNPRQQGPKTLFVSYAFSGLNGWTTQGCPRPPSHVGPKRIANERSGSVWECWHSSQTRQKGQEAPSNHQLATDEVFIISAPSYILSKQMHYLARAGCYSNRTRREHRSWWEENMNNNKKSFSA